MENKTVVWECDWHDPFLLYIYIKSSMNKLAWFMEYNINLYSNTE